MGDDDKYDSKLKTIGTRPNGGRAFDPIGKEKLIVECLKPGVSLAGLAVANGLNPNLLRKWVAARKKKLGYNREQEEQAASSAAPHRPSAFIQVVTASEPVNAVEVDTTAAIEAPGDYRRPDPLKGLFSETVAPLLEARPDLLTFTVLEAMLDRHPDLGPKVRRTLERHLYIGGEPATVGEDDVIRPAQEPERFLRTEETALFLGLSRRTLEKHRTYGTGPLYRKLGGRVVYALTDLERWTKLGTVSSTSDPRGMVRAATPQNRTNAPQMATDRGSQNHDSSD